MSKILHNGLLDDNFMLFYIEHVNEKHYFFLKTTDDDDGRISSFLFQTHSDITFFN